MNEALREDLTYLNCWTRDEAVTEYEMIRALLVCVACYEFTYDSMNVYTVKDTRCY